ncbi:MAG: radical SAM protein [Anaerolineaceae bacterium]
MSTSSQNLITSLGPVANLLVQSGPQLVKNRPLRKMIVKSLKKSIITDLKIKRQQVDSIPGVDEDKAAFGLAIVDTLDRALENRYFSDSVIHTLLNIVGKDLFLKQGENMNAAADFRAATGCNAPTFMVISPGKACNLQCTGCYANAGIMTNEKLSWETFDRIITEAKTLWGVRFFVISGGEPMAYRSEGKDLLDMAEKHNDCFFMMYTNGTLIDEKATERLAKIGNLSPAFSLEGWRERTDTRRGKGVFDKVLAGMERLRNTGVPYGMSLTATCENAEEILSDEFMDFFYKEQGVIYSWIFHYMPIGRSVSLNLMPTPQQRLWMWHKSWELIREKSYFLADFWNHGTVCDGCLSAGSDTGGGYFYIDWNGIVSPCVFMPYSPININDAYRNGKTLNDVWQDPFFTSLRNWQKSYKQKNGNWLMPCPIRDHHSDLRKMLEEYRPEPSDESAQEALLDPDYAAGMDRYDQAYQSLSDVIWQDHYLREVGTEDNPIGDLPDISRLIKKQEA